MYELARVIVSAMLPDTIFDDVVDAVREARFLRETVYASREGKTTVFRSFTPSSKDAEDVIAYLKAKLPKHEAVTLEIVRREKYEN